MKPSRDDSIPTNIWRPCPETPQSHPQVRTGCMVMKGPKAYWYACAVCGTRVLVAIKLLRPSKGHSIQGLTRAEAEAQGLLCL